ncbi:hypothetical protein ABW21_db0206204 [Orbilia brochopaga]|nr:hypothetical protein ABW21_db0206204 [Drechslerella brochopaga]
MPGIVGILPSLSELMTFWSWSAGSVMICWTTESGAFLMSWRNAGGMLRGARKLKTRSLRELVVCWRLGSTLGASNATLSAAPPSWWRAATSLEERVVNARALSGMAEETEARRKETKMVETFILTSEKWN